MEVGSTKKEEVLLTLGPPNYTRDNERDFIYQWNTESGLVLEIAGMGGSRTEKYTYYKTYQLLIEFDDIGIVKGFEIKEEKTHTRHERLF